MSNLVSISLVLTRNNLPRIVANMDNKLQTALDHATAVCIREADKQTRRDTGDLIRNKTIDKGAEDRVVHWLMEYAIYQNEGTSVMSGTHFAQAGLDAALPDLQNGLKGLFT